MQTYGELCNYWDPNPNNEADRRQVSLRSKRNESKASEKPYRVWRERALANTCEASNVTFEKIKRCERSRRSRINEGLSII